AAEEHEANRPPWQKSGGLNRARRLNHQRRVAAIVERSRTQLPRIQMRAENDNFIWLFIAADFAYNVLLFDRPANFVGHVEVHSHFSRIASHGPYTQHPVFA